MRTGVLSAAKAAPVLLAVIAFGACGTNSQFATTTTNGARSRALSVEEFSARAERACAELLESTRSLPDVLPPDYEVMATHTREFAAATERFVRTLRGLTPPKGDQAAIERYIDWYATELILIKRLLRATEEHDSAQIASLTEEMLKLVRNRGYGYVRRYGLGACNWVR